MLRAGVAICKRRCLQLTTCYPQTFNAVRRILGSCCPKWSVKRRWAVQSLCVYNYLQKTDAKMKHPKRCAHASETSRTLRRSGCFQHNVPDHKRIVFGNQELSCIYDE